MDELIGTLLASTLRVATPLTCAPWPARSASALA